MQRTAVAAAFVCLGLSFFAFVMLPNNAPSSATDAQVPLLKDESALIQKEVTIHRSSAMEETEHASTMLEQAEEMAGELLAYKNEADGSEEFSPYDIPEVRGLHNASFFHDRNEIYTMPSKYIKNGEELAKQAYLGAWEIEDATNAYLESMDNMTNFIGSKMNDRNGGFYVKYMHRAVTDMKVFIGETSYQYMDLATAGLNATNFGPESGEILNKSKTRMNRMAKQAIETMDKVGKTVKEMNKQYAPGVGMGMVEEQMGGWRELCPKIKEPMVTTLDMLNGIVELYKKHSVVLMNAIDESLPNYPVDFQPQIVQWNQFMDRMLGMNINVFLKLQDDLYVGMESLSLKFRLCQTPTNKPLHQVQKEKRRGSLMHRPQPKESGASQLGIGFAAAAACVASLV